MKEYEEVTKVGVFSHNSDIRLKKKSSSSVEIRALSMNEQPPVRGEVSDMLN